MIFQKHAKKREAGNSPTSRHILDLQKSLFLKSGASVQIRTGDLRITSALLYLLSHAGLFWSGQRDSNPRPLAWEANALPAELYPHNQQRIYYHTFLKSSSLILFEVGNLAFAIILHY